LASLSGTSGQLERNIFLEAVPGSLSARLGHASLLFATFFNFLELVLFFEKQFLDHAAFYRIGSDFEHFAIVLNILPPDKPFHDYLSKVSRRVGR
jgi:hypothetical protein